MRHALPAQRAVGLRQRNAAGDVHRGMRGAAREVPHAGRLDLLAHLDAAQAADALVVVADQRIGIPAVLVREVLGVRQARDAQVVGERLQRAVAGAHAARALRVVPREQELDVDLARHAHLGAVGAHHHAVEHAVVARGDELVDALHLDDAHAARAHLVQVLQVAERRDLDARRAGGVEDGGVVRDLDLAGVDRELYHWKVLPPR